MAKKIYMTDADVESVVDELRNTLSGMRCYGSIDIKRSFKGDDRFALVYFTPIAWAKMTTLVARYDTEVQWHGRVRRISESEFEVYDIMVPPHEVTGTTVTSEYAPYGEWLNELDDDTFNSVKFHGHSHVNMPVSPSPTDTKYRLDLVTQLPKPVRGMDVFYIFLIINKRHEWSAEIYDFTNNALYSTADIAIDTVVDEENGTGLEHFIALANKVAVRRKYVQTDYSKQGGSAWGIPSYKGSAYEQPKNVTPISQVSQPGAPAKEHTAVLPSDSGKKKAKGKKNGGGKCFGYDTWADYYEAVCPSIPKSQPAGSGSKTIDDDTSKVDDINDPTSPFYASEWGCT